VASTRSPRSPASPACRLHRTSPDGRARVVADAGTHRRGALPRRAPVAGDRYRSWLPAQHASPSGRRACWRISWEPPTCVPARVLDRLKVAYMEKQPGRRPVSGFTPVATLPAHPTALGRALPAFCPFAVEMTIRRGLRALHPAHRDLARPLPPRAGRHPAHPGRGDRGEFKVRACVVAVPVFGPGGELVASIELTVRDLSKELQAVRAALVIASHSLSRELSGDARPSGPARSDRATPLPRSSRSGQPRSPAGACEPAAPPDGSSEHPRWPVTRVARLGACSFD
jgi:hypothetical protein